MTTGADLVLTREARRIALHHRLVRLRRFSRELDRLLAPPIDPWDYAEPVDWDLLAAGVAERDRGGRELLAAGWCP